jgi:hypothetical protein
LPRVDFEGAAAAGAAAGEGAAAAPAPPGGKSSGKGSAVSSAPAAATPSPLLAAEPLDALVLRVRAVAALLAVAAECGLSNIHDDAAPHPQASLLAAVGAWLVELATPRLGDGLVLLPPRHIAALARAVSGAAAALLELN